MIVKLFLINTVSDKDSKLKYSKVTCRLCWT